MIRSILNVPPDAVIRSSTFGKIRLSMMWPEISIRSENESTADFAFFAMVDQLPGIQATRGTTLRVQCEMLSGSTALFYPEAVASVREKDTETSKAS